MTVSQKPPHDKDVSNSMNSWLDLNEQALWEKIESNIDSIEGANNAKRSRSRSRSRNDNRTNDPVNSRNHRRWKQASSILTLIALAASAMLTLHLHDRTPASQNLGTSLMDLASRTQSISSSTTGPKTAAQAMIHTETAADRATQLDTAAGQPNIYQRHKGSPATDQIEQTESSHPDLHPQTHGRQAQFVDEVSLVDTLAQNSQLLFTVITNDGGMRTGTHGQQVEVGEHLVFRLAAFKQSSNYDRDLQQNLQTQDSAQKMNPMQHKTVSAWFNGGDNLPPGLSLSVRCQGPSSGVQSIVQAFPITRLPMDVRDSGGFSAYLLDQPGVHSCEYRIQHHHHSSIWKHAGIEVEAYSTKHHAKPSKKSPGQASVADRP